MAWGSPFAIEAWVNDPSSRRFPFIERYRAAQTVGVHVDREHGVLAGQVVEHSSDVLGVHFGPTGSLDRQRVESLACLRVVGERGGQVVPVTSFREHREEFRHRLSNVPDNSQSHRGPASDLLSPNVNLDYLRFLRVELTIWEIGPEHQDDIRGLKCLVSRGEAEQSGHSHVARVRVLHELLPSERMNDRSLQSLG